MRNKSKVTSIPARALPPRPALRAPVRPGFQTRQPVRTAPARSARESELDETLRKLREMSK